MSARVLHLAATDRGGAGRAAVRLHLAMAVRRVQSTMIVWDRRGDYGDVSLVAGKSAGGRLRRFGGRAWFRIASRREYFFRDQRCSISGSTRLVEQVSALAPDLIIVHYISDFASFSDIAKLQAVTGARIVWNLLDMADLTGGCHYAWDCRGFEESCGNCPALILSGPVDASRRTMTEKRQRLERLDQVVVAPSSGVEAQARRSSLFANADIRRILIGIDPAEIALVDREQARHALELPIGETILFFGAQTFDDRRKGMDILLSALKIVRTSISDDRALPFLLVAGGGDGAEQLDTLGFPIRRLGYIDTNSLAMVYAAADFFICPSVEDSGPMMVNEAIMAGTPVIAFAIGVVPDLVTEPRTGVIAGERTAPSLAAAILRGLSWDREQRATARNVCRSTAIELCSLDTQVAQILALASHLPVGMPTGRDA